MPRKLSLRDQIWPMCEKFASDMGYELCDISLDSEPTGQYLRIYIDKDGGVGLDDCEKYHHAVQPKLEKYDYDFMEVCSPGIDRPLKTERDIQKSLGSLVEVKFYKSQDGEKSCQGQLLDMNADAVRIIRSGEEKSYPRKAVALVKLVPDLSGLDEQSDAEIQDIIDDE